MTFEEAIALQPAWIGLWLNVLFIGAFILPLLLLIWRESRLTAVITLVSSVVAGFGVFQLYDLMGYVRLLGLPHVMIWTPLVYYLYRQIKKPAMPKYARLILCAISAILIISLAFDYLDVLRYILGERAPLV